MMIPLALFISFFALYSHGAGPWVVPYRDVGEMSVLLKTLSVAHPPGYPLYTLLGKLATLIPLGNVAYRTNIFSALCGAAAVAAFFILMKKITDRTSAVASSLFLGFSISLWELSSVSEMYSLGALWLCLILICCLDPRYRNLFPFLYALGLGARMDLLLLLPIFILWFWIQPIRPDYRWGAVFFILGLTVFLYLPIRSRGNPIIDWGNPDTLGAMFASMRRKSYSGTLDLLSLSYKPGENFLANIILYGRHLVSSFGWVGLCMGILGLYKSVTNKNRPLMLVGVLLVLAGPVFLFLANMPPNPHAVAIIEASYLLPDILFVLFVGAGFLMLGQFIRPKPALFFLALGLVGLNAVNSWDRCSKRENFYVRDYVDNVMKSLPPHSVAVFHKDVQLFSMWYAQLVDQRRADVSILSTGLSGSPWYWEMMNRWGVAAAPPISLKTPDGWKEMKRVLTRPFRTGYDIDIPVEANLPLMGMGSVLVIGSDANAQDISLLKDLSVYRGTYHYGETPDFFSTDLIGDQARAHHQQAVTLLLSGEKEKSEWLLTRSESMDPTIPVTSNDLGYLYFVKGDLNQALRCYSDAAQKNAVLLEQAHQYNALADSVGRIKGDLANTYISMGGTMEKLGNKEKARAVYNQSLDLMPSAQAHYNLAVSYWNQDWSQVVNHLEQALKINPAMNEARQYLAVAQAKMKT